MGTAARRKAIPLASKLEVLAFWTEPGQDTIYCYYCMKEGGLAWHGRAPKLLDGFEWDHRVPVSRGGTNDAENLVIACGPCNRRKGARLDFVGSVLGWLRANYPEDYL